MAPGNGAEPGGGTVAVAVSAERALSFLSRSIDRDLRLMSSRGAKSIRRLADGLDEWESFMIPSSSRGGAGGAGGGAGGDSRGSAGAQKLWRTLEDGSKALTRVSSGTSLDEFALFRNLKQKIAPPFPAGFTQMRKSRSVPDFGLSSEDVLAKATSAVKTKSIVAKEEWEKIKKRLPTDSRGVIKRVKDGLKELESTAAAGLKELETTASVKTKTPQQFFQNVKKNLRLAVPYGDTAVRAELDSSTERFGSDVPPLDLPEVLESIVLRSEPFLDQLGVKREVSGKVCDMLRSWRKKDPQTAVPSNGHQASGGSMSCIGGPQATGDCRITAAEELDRRVNQIVESTGYRRNVGVCGESFDLEQRQPKDSRRNVAIVTTASLPWMTGTSINPLLRAAYLARLGKNRVTLVVPWLSKNDQDLVFPKNIRFDSPEEQEDYVRTWLEARVGFKSDFRISFYPGKYSTQKRSIFAVGDVTKFIPDHDADVAVLEEPEHLTWYHHGERWTNKFDKVVGIIHTNYLEYVRREKNGAVQAFFLERVNNWVARWFCHKVVRLSGATQDMPRSEICNVHGVCPKFLDIGEKINGTRSEGKEAFDKGAYFLGKMVWGKGYRELLDLLSAHQKRLDGLQLDIFGSGDDAADVKSSALNLGLPVKFYDGRDHADDSLHGYKVFINPSLSDVVCTTTAEALAMGKIVVCADHPSNEFFASFPNCYQYKTPEEFVEKVKMAMESVPLPLSQEQQHLLSWEAATERFLKVAEIDDDGLNSDMAGTADPSSGVRKRNRKDRKTAMKTMGPGSRVMEGIADSAVNLLHEVASGFEAGRVLSGAIPDTLHFNAHQCKEMGMLPPAVQQPVYGL